MNILITRPSPDGENLVSKLLSIGKFAYHLPLIYFSEGKTLSLLQKQLSVLSKGDFLFIVSQNAIRYAHNQLLSMGISWPTTLMYYSVGKTTSLKMYNLSGISVKYPRYQETSEGLLELPELIYINNRHVLILRGNDGRTILENTLQKRGAKVMCCECYSRKPVQYNGEEQCARMLSLGIKVLVITTGSMLKQLYYLIPKYYRILWLIKCKLIVVSVRLAVLARQLGWTDIIIANSANNTMLVHIILKYL